MKTRTGLNHQRTFPILSRCFIAAVILAGCILTSCSSKEDFLNPTVEDDGSLTSKSLHCGKVFTVSPSGNYNDDSYAIQKAFNDAVIAGPGSTVQLTRGKFYLKERIEVAGFNGFFKGAGKEKTVLTTHDKVKFDIPDYQAPALIKFRCGNINMSDMSIVISDPEPCINENQVWYGNNLPYVIYITGNDVNPGTESQSAKFTFMNLKFVGGNGNVFGLNYNVEYFIQAAWESDNNVIYPLSGGYKITNCEFNRAYTCFSTAFTGGPCIIGGNETSGNKFEDAEVGVGVFDITSSFSTVSYNKFNRIHWYGIADWQGIYAPPCTLPRIKFTAYKNDISLSSYAPGEEAFTVGISPVDYGIFAGTCSEPKLDVVVTNNRIQINDIGFGGIIPQDLMNAMITNNVVSGKGTTGIGAGFWTKPPDYTEYDQESDYLIKGNNLKGMEASVAPIWLGPGTSHFLVYADKNDVLDEGTNNTLIGDHIKRPAHSGQKFNKQIMPQYERMINKTHHEIK